MHTNYAMRYGTFGKSCVLKTKQSMVLFRICDDSLNRAQHDHSGKRYDARNEWRLVIKHTVDAFGSCFDSH